MLRRLAAVLALAALIALAPNLDSARAQDAPGRAVSIELSGTIDPATAGWVERALREAEASGARLAILRLDTPGGLDSSMRRIVQAMLGSPLPVVVHVTPSGARAASAGLFVTQAADVAVMAPGTNIGAATPVRLSGGETSEVLGRKVRNDAAAYVTALARLHDRDPALAERMVRDAVSVTAGRAREAGLVDLVAGPDELLAAVDGLEVAGPKAQTLRTAGLEVGRRDMGFGVEARQLLVQPGLASLLLVGGLLLIALELLSPGLVGPGVLGAVALALGLYGTAQLPVTVVGVVLLLVGLGALVAETQVASGLLGAGGVVALVAGVLLLYDTGSEALAVSVPAALTVGVLLGGLVVFAASRAVAARGQPPRGEPEEELVGRRADVRQRLDPAGQVYVQGALWRARTAAGEPVAEGRSVVVDEVDGLTLVVRPAGEPEPERKEAT